MSKKLGGYMRWVPVMLSAPVSRRKEWVENIMEGFRSFRKKSDDKSIPYLSDLLTKNKEYQLVGFVPKVEYIKVDGPNEHLNVMFEHQHMNPMLMYKHKTLSILIITGPGLQWDKDSGIAG